MVVEHEPLPSSINRLTLSDKKDWLGLNRPRIYYDVGDYVRRSAEQYTIPTLKKMATALGAIKFDLEPEFLHSDHIMGVALWGRTHPTQWWMLIAVLMIMRTSFFLAGLQ